jgi:hypothetical protein
VACREETVSRASGGDSRFAWAKKGAEAEIWDRNSEIFFRLKTGELHESPDFIGENTLQKIFKKLLLKFAPDSLFVLRR